MVDTTEGSSALQTDFPPTQVSPAPTGWPHFPQLFGSVCRSTHWLPHFVQAEQAEATQAVPVWHCTSSLQADPAGRQYS